MLTANSVKIPRTCGGRSKLSLLEQCQFRGLSQGFPNTVSCTKDTCRAEALTTVLPDQLGRKCVALYQCPLSADNVVKACKLFLISLLG